MKHFNLLISGNGARQKLKKLTSDLIMNGAEIIMDSYVFTCIIDIADNSANSIGFVINVLLGKSAVKIRNFRWQN